MKSALHIISSGRGAQSYSRGLSTAIIKKLIDKNEIDTVVERDLTKFSRTLITLSMLPKEKSLPVRRGFLLRVN